jgi:hypothetical protein
MKPFAEPSGAVETSSAPKMPKVFKNEPMILTGGARVKVMEGGKAPKTKPFYGMCAPGRF